MTVLERIQKSGRAFREAVKFTSRGDVETRATVKASLRETLRASEEKTAAEKEDYLLAWASGSNPKDVFLPWLNNQITVARTSARANISSPYMNAYYQGMEDGLRSVGILFTKGVKR